MVNNDIVYARALTMSKLFWVYLVLDFAERGVNICIMSDIEKKKRPKLKIIARGPFENLVRIVYDLLKREKELPSTGDVSTDLKILEISPESQWGPSAKEVVARIREEEKLNIRIQATVTNIERMRRLREAEVERRKQIAMETLAKIKEGRPEDSVVGSPMADLGIDSGKGRRVAPKPNSDGEYPND